MWFGRSWSLLLVLLFASAAWVACTTLSDRETTPEPSVVTAQPVRTAPVATASPDEPVDLDEAEEAAPAQPEAQVPAVRTRPVRERARDRKKRQAKTRAHEVMKSGGPGLSGLGQGGGGYGKAVGRGAVGHAYGAGVSTPPMGATVGGLGSDDRFDREAYDHLTDNPFKDPVTSPLSTFSIDVDTASYSNVRRFLEMDRLPPKDAVRIEELVNYFPYGYAPPDGEAPFSSHVELTSCPWAPTHRLVRIGLRGKDVSVAERPAANLVFLLDVSGSMGTPQKLPLLKRGMKLLVEQLNGNDRVTIVVYAGAAGLVLPPTSGRDKATILAALDHLSAGGSTNGGAGIQLAYQKAREQHIEGGINRVILATDGDFNVGISGQGALVRLIKKQAKTGTFLSVLGFGMGNYQDARLEKIADKGNGNYAYIDTLREARKVLVEQMSGTLITIAKDVKIQVEFNPHRVAAYRLIGYENRILAARDFNDDKKDAGEIGAGHTVTALYEIVPSGQVIDVPGIDPLKYQRPRPAAPTGSEELLTLKLRYKQPEGHKSTKIEFPVVDRGASWREASADLRFAAGVAAFGMLLRDSKHKGDASWATVMDLVDGARAHDPGGYRAELAMLVGKARRLSAKSR